MSDSLVLHWPLNALAPQNVILDSGPNAINGIYKGTPTIVTDQKFACLSLDGKDQYVSVPAGNPALQLTAYTLSAWIKWAPGGANSAVAVFGKASPNIRLRLYGDGRLEHLFDSTVGLETTLSDAGAVPGNVWAHVAITHDGGVARTYVDGALVAQAQGRGSRVADQAEFELAAGNGTLSFAGLVAQFRVYSRALTTAEIQRDMADSEPPLEAFVRTHPLDFGFVNNDGQPVLFIDDTNLQVMSLEVTNSSRHAIEAVPLTGVSSSTYHFALRLRKGTLAAALTPKVSSADWAIAAEPDGTALYFQWKNNLKPILPGATISVDVSGLNADGTDGTHGTQVELEYGTVRYTGQSQPLAGTRVQYLDVVNHRGRRDLPLDLRFVGGDRVLSDGATASALTLHLTNVMSAGKGISFQTAEPVSAFRVSFDAEPDGASPTAKNEKPWALTTVGAAGNISLSVSAGWSITKVLDRERAWDITPDADTLLTPGQFIEFRLDKVYALPKQGHAPILVEYRNIPGYADGSMTAPVERTPLLFNQSFAGVNFPPTDLEGRFQILHTPTDANGVPALIIGRKRDQNLRLGYGNDHTWIQSHSGLPLALNPLGNRVGVGVSAPASRLHIVDANQDATNGTLIIGPTNQSNLRLGYHASYSWIQSHGGKPLLLNPVASAVGIGAVTEPKGRLHVVNVSENSLGGALYVGPDNQAHIRFGHHQDYSWIQSGGAKPLAINPLGTDPVAIGTSGPLGGKVTIMNAGSHLQLRRDTGHGGGGQVLYLELFQDTTTGDAITYPSIRFHHGSKFWHRIEGRPEGFAFKDGNLPSDTFVDAYAQTFVASNGFRIKDVTIGVEELRILKRLAAGALEFDLFNVKQGEYAYAADYKPYDGDRRNVWTWRRKERIDQGRWRITFPS
ncbi:LamG domain-containing protein [Kineosporia babensis]|uniref:LamG domain-containing protein n=1 Tax=Kineosporia babensis TaxID=499548 RepID=A0A9X1NHN9_9ACTN|nr:LamG domain-containing protein [Kineosporia babensis]MCD5315202.1 LamG domain-containing protein [Kineosporia babensis]